MNCRLCPRQCNVRRTPQQNNGGYCKMPLLPRVARAALHFWEEPVISGKNGSGTIFFSGCSLSCIYCQNFEVSRGIAGKEITVNRLAKIFSELEQKGAHNINLVTPTHYALAIKEALDIYRPKIPICYNSGGYESTQTLKMLEGYIDIFLLDFKYLSENKAKEYSNAPDYPNIAKAAILECYRQQPECVIEDGIMKKGLIVRHLVLPLSTNDAIGIFDWVKDNAPNAFFSLMSQYLPFGDAKNHPVLNRKITKREYEKVLNHICDFNFSNVFIQERGSADEQFIPPFNLCGV